MVDLQRQLSNGEAYVTPITKTLGRFHPDGYNPEIFLAFQILGIVVQRGNFPLTCVVSSNGSDRKLNGGDHMPSFASSNGVDYPKEFSNVAHPMEPVDLDQPIRCPPPEPCIMHDGRVWKDRMIANSRRRSDLLGSMRDNDHIEYYSSPTHRRRRSRSRESFQNFTQPPALTAPDLVVTKIIE